MGGGLAACCCCVPRQRPAAGAAAAHPAPDASAPLSRAAALTFSVTGRDPRLIAAGTHVRMSEYVRGYLGERVALFFGFTEYMQSTLAALAACGLFMYIWQVR